MWVPSRLIENRATLDSTTANIVLCADAELWHPMAAYRATVGKQQLRRCFLGRRKRTPREPVLDHDRSGCGEYSVRVPAMAIRPAATTIDRLSRHLRKRRHLDGVSDAIG